MSRKHCRWMMIVCYHSTTTVQIQWQLVKRVMHTIISQTTTTTTCGRVNRTEASLAVESFTAALQCWPWLTKRDNQNIHQSRPNEMKINSPFVAKNVSFIPPRDQRGWTARQIMLTMSFRVLVKFCVCVIRG